MNCIVEALVKVRSSFVLINYLHKRYLIIFLLLAGPGIRGVRLFKSEGMNYDVDGNDDDDDDDDDDSDYDDGYDDFADGQSTIKTIGYKSVAFLNQKKEWENDETQFSKFILFERHDYDHSSIHC
jgi:hypothetical protein